MSKGWIKLHRCLLDKAIWQKSNAEQRSVLITILLMANNQETQWEWNGKQFNALPGQFVTSSSGLAEKSKVNRQSVRSALVKFEKYGFLTKQSTKTGILISIVNWRQYQQDNSEPNQATNQDPTKTQPRPNQDPTTNKNLRTKECRTKEKDLINILSDSEKMFDVFWQEYPKKTGKQAARNSWNRIKPNENLFNKMLDTIKVFKNSEQWTREGGIFTPNPATWLNQHRWEDELFENRAPIMPKAFDSLRRLRERNGLQ